MKKHLIILALTSIFGALILDLFLGLHYAYSPNESILMTYVIWFVLVAIFCACLYLTYYVVRWIKKKYFPDISSYVEVATVNGHGARELEYKLSKNGIAVYIDDSKHPLPCRILVPAEMQEQAMEVLGSNYA